MADRPIQVGDLVIVVRATYCCNVPLSVREIFKVTGFLATGGYKCLACGGIRPDSTPSVLGGSQRGGFHPRRLKRLDPDALLDETPTREEIEA